MKQLWLLLLVSPMLFATIELPENFQSDFIQKITNAKNKVIEYRGKISFSSKRLFKWHYTKPTQKEVCTNGSRLVVVDHDLEQVSRYRIAKGIDIAKILHNASLYGNNIYIAHYQNKKYTIQLYRQKLHSIAYFDDLDNKVQIVFKHMRYGQDDFSDKKMQCVVPETYDVIEG